MVSLSSLTIIKTSFLANFVARASLHFTLRKILTTNAQPSVSLEISLNWLAAVSLFSLTTLRLIRLDFPW